MRTVPPRARRSSARWLAAVVAVVAAATVGCSSDGGGSAGGSTTAPANLADIGDTGDVTTANYLSIGDSYAQGFQPTVDGATPPYTDGYAYLVPDLAAAKGWDLQLVNFGCGGATVSSLSFDDGCNVPARSPGGPTYDDRSQLEAAITFLEDHPGQVELITVSIGGNDVTACATGVDDPIGCVTDAVGRIDDDLTSMLGELRDAAGPDTVIVGLTYPNVILGAYLQEASRPLAELSVTAFKSLINPALQRSYESVDGVFVDVTAGTDGYVPLTETTTSASYGEVPVAVATVCDLTWFCERGDIHPRSAGYERIAELIVEELPTR